MVAEDRHLASEVARLSSVGATTDAHDVIARAADDILHHCDGMSVITPLGRDSPLAQSLKNVERVAKRSDQLGDEVQTSWCVLLRQKLAGGAWPPA
jgi:hypothetical protein